MTERRADNCNLSLWAFVSRYWIENGLYNCIFGSLVAAQRFIGFFCLQTPCSFLFQKRDYHQVSPWRIGPTIVFCYISENKVQGWYTIKQQPLSCHSQAHYSRLSLVQLYTSTAKEDRWRSFGSCKPQGIECRTLFLSWFTPCSPLLYSMGLRLKRRGSDWKAFCLFLAPDQLPVIIILIRWWETMASAFRTGVVRTPKILGLQAENPLRMHDSVYIGEDLILGCVCSSSEEEKL